MKQKKDEFIPGDPAVRKNWMILISLYVLFLVWLEPLIDFMLMQIDLDRSPEAISALNQRKEYVTAVAFGVARCVPILLFLWLGGYIMQAMKIPPKGIRLPFTVKVIKGPKAKMIGMGMVAVALLLLLREVSMLVTAQPVY